MPLKILKLSDIGTEIAYQGEVITFFYEREFGWLAYNAGNLYKCADDIVKTVFDDTEGGALTIDLENRKQFEQDIQNGMRYYYVVRGNQRLQKAGDGFGVTGQSGSIPHYGGKPHN